MTSTPKRVRKAGNRTSAKPSADLPRVQYPRKAVQVHVNKSDSEEQIMHRYAALATSPELAAYRVINGVEAKSSFGDQLDVPALMTELRNQAGAVNGGDLTQAEAMLMNQATALQSLFSVLAARGMGCDQIPGFEANMRMALRAQNQCRATLETLATIKNPPVMFAKQANVTTGPQQINNGAAALSHAREIESEQSKLLEHQHGQRLDIGTAGAAIGSDSTMATVGKIDRAKVGRG